MTPERLAEIKARCEKACMRVETPMYPQHNCDEFYVEIIRPLLTVLEQAQRRLAWLEEGRLLLINVQQDDYRWRDAKELWLAAEPPAREGT